jgi:hypothetical protein
MGYPSHGRSEKLILSWRLRGTWHCSMLQFPARTAPGLCFRLFEEGWVVGFCFEGVGGTRLEIVGWGGWHDQMRKAILSAMYNCIY